MTQKAFRCSALLLAVASWLAAGRAQAGGVMLYEVGTPDVGYASAGYASRADEPATVLTNPAGMSRLDGVQVQVGAQALYGNLQFSPGPLTSVPGGGNNGGNALGWLPGGGAFATFEVLKDVRLGFATFSNFGLTEGWQSGWVGRYYATKSTLIGLSLMPALSWHIVAGLSVGATLNVMYGHLEYQAAINNSVSTDGSLSMSSNTWGVGGNVGILYEFSEKTRLGATYTSPVGLNFSSSPVFRDVRITGLDSLKLDLGMTVPQTVMFSGYQKIGDRWAVMADVGWQNWAAFGTVELQASRSDSSGNPVATTTNIGYLNTWHGAVGTQVYLSDPFQLNFGVAYDSTMTNPANRSLPLAIGDAWRFGAGAQWDVDKGWRVALAYEFLWGGSPSVDVDRGPLAGRVTGSYADTWFQFIALGFTWKS